MSAEPGRTGTKKDLSGMRGWIGQRTWQLFGFTSSRLQTWWTCGLWCVHGPFIHCLWCCCIRRAAKKPRACFPSTLVLVERETIDRWRFHFCLLLCCRFFSGMNWRLTALESWLASRSGGDRGTCGRRLVCKGLQHSRQRIPDEPGAKCDPRHSM